MTNGEQPIQEVLERLGSRGKVARSGGGWVARCPCRNDDENPSITVTELSTGQVLINCHRGEPCSFEEIASALGMEERDFWPVQIASSTTQRVPTDVYDYRDAEGELQYQVCRFYDSVTLKKTFRQRKPDGHGGWDWNTAGLTKILYRLPEVLEEVAKGGTVHICYAPDTEILTPTGWLPLPDLTTDHEVAQWSMDGQVQFVHPRKTQVFKFDGELVHLQADFSDLLVTPEHRQPAHHARCSMKVIEAQHVTQLMRLPVSGLAEGFVGPTPTEARLLAAWLGDGVNERRGQRVQWNLKKSRKIDRLLSLLDGVEVRVGSAQSTPEWTQVRLDRSALPLKWVGGGKDLDWSALNWPLESRQAFLDELAEWDGDRTGLLAHRFFTGKRHEAEIVTAMAAISGYGAILRVDHREGRNDSYVVNLKSTTERALGNTPKRVPYQGLVYCCTVPSGFLVTRRNGKVTISGNCEGEKDVETLRREGLVATCNTGGAGKWQVEYNDLFHGATVRVFADNDEPGYKHARAIISGLRDVGVEVTGYTAPAPYKDLSEALNADTGLEEFLLFDPDGPGDPFAEVVASLSDLSRKINLRLDQKVMRAKSLLDSVVAEVPVDEGRLTTWRDFLDEVADDSYKWLIPHLLEEQERVIVVAIEGAGKTTLARQVAMCCGSGLNPFTFNSIDVVPTLFVDLENPERVIRRAARRIQDAIDLTYRHRGSSRPEPQNHLWLKPDGINLMKAGHRLMLERKIVETTPRLLVLGPLYKAFIDPGSRTSESVVTEVVTYLDYLRSTYNLALWLEHHAPLSESPTGRNIRPFGSAVWSRWPEFGFGMTFKEENGAFTYTMNPFRGAREARPWPKTMTRGSQFPFEVIDTVPM